MVILDYDSNHIFTFPLPSKSQTHLLQAFNSIHNKLVTKGQSPEFVRLDNEAPKTLKTYMHTSNLTFQLVPPHNHRRNFAEKAIGTFKDHFIAGLCSLNPSFPLKLWCRLLPHAELTINLLRQFRIHPQLSVHEDIQGPYDYNAHPILPPGVKIVLHEKLSQPGSWAPRGQDGWYLGPALEHHRCHRVYCTRINSERTTDTVDMFLHSNHHTNITTQEAAILATESRTQALQNIASQKKFGNKQLLAIEQLAKILNQATFQTPPHHTPKCNAVNPGSCTTTEGETSPNTALTNAF